MGTQYIGESDIIDIVKQHFYKYGQGFKQVKINVDLVQINQPRISMEIGLEPLNKVLPSEEIEKLYYDLLNTCKEFAQVETEMFNKIYDMVESKKISKKVFRALVKRIKGY
jgi:hypothetical protein